MFQKYSIHIQDLETGAKQIVISETTAIDEYQKMIQRCDKVLEDMKASNS